ncbi:MULTISPECIES: hypothetical protein [Hymenobacter]|uniref:Lipoprotein n=1 Tax=Hymenobacter guriensis TaxID=2793065 RepID=A0ABS0L856_9BACT|nr:MULTISPECIES: hypothetical protein [Hymenobacter]MBG8555703.1 hypothetical protein [Hymenobacter guriensis]MCR5889121.1 hypothetical protein [Hymenobacter sp. J193]
MKKLLILASVALVGLGACNRTQCPAYTSTKEANRVSSPVMASTATSAEHQ